MIQYQMIQNFLMDATFYLLIGATLTSWVNLFFLNSQVWSLSSKSFTFSSTLALIFLLIIRWQAGNYFPLSNLYESILFLCVLLLLGQQVAEFKFSTILMKCLTLPVVFCLYWFGNSGLPPEMKTLTALPPSLQSYWLMMHVSIIMLSYATLILGSLLSLLFLILQFYSSKQSLSSPLLAYFKLGQEKNLVKKDQEVQFSLLEVIDIWSYRLIGLGFPFLTLGIISGAIWANEAWGAYWSWDPKECWALITWLVFAIYLHARLMKGWNGKKTATIGSLGFIIIWICYLGVNFLGKGLHSYGWIS